MSLVMPHQYFIISFVIKLQGISKSLLRKLTQCAFQQFFLFLWLLIHPRRKYRNGTYFVATGCACACGGACASACPCPCACPCGGAYFSSISSSVSDCSCTGFGSGSVFVAEGPVSRILDRMLTRLNRELEVAGSSLIEGQLWQHLVPCAWLSGGTGSATVQHGSS